MPAYTKQETRALTGRAYVRRDGRPGSIVNAEERGEACDVRLREAVLRARSNYHVLSWPAARGVPRREPGALCTKYHVLGGDPAPTAETALSARCAGGQDCGVLLLG